MQTVYRLQRLLHRLLHRLHWQTLRLKLRRSDRHRKLVTGAELELELKRVRVRLRMLSRVLSRVLR